jgi:hypothetical protein
VEVRPDSGSCPGDSTAANTGGAHHCARGRDRQAQNGAPVGPCNWLTELGIHAPEGCQRGTHTNGTAYPLPTHEVLSYASTHTQTQAPRAKGLTPRAKALTPQPRHRRNSRCRYEYTRLTAGARSKPSKPYIVLAHAEPREETLHRPVLSSRPSNSWCALASPSR